MATQNFCSWFKFGYCKHKEFCRRQHINHLCEKIDCEVLSCSSRHPKTCKFYRDYGKCKFNPCMFSHVKKENNYQIDILMKENVSILKKLVDIDNSISELESKIQQSEELITKLNEVENKCQKVIDIEKRIYEISALATKVETIENKLVDKDTVISDLMVKVKEMEISFKQHAKLLIYVKKLIVKF